MEWKIIIHINLLNTSTGNKQTCCILKTVITNDENIIKKDRRDQKYKFIQIKYSMRTKMQVLLHS